MEIIKETSHMGVLVIKEVDFYLAKDMIIQNHYSHKWNTAFGKVNIGIFRQNSSECLGVASFGNLMNPNSYKSICSDFESKNVIELNRLWISDELGMNAETILLGASWKIIKATYPEIKAVQSFADGRLGCGTIYKASNFNYYGYSESLFYENIDTHETQHKVPMENTMRPNGMIKLNVLYCQNKLKPFYVKTYRYIYPLYKNIKIDLKQINYPEYDKGIIEIENYKHNPSLIFRAYLLALILNQEDDYKILHKFIKNNYKEIAKEELKKALDNKSIIKIANDRNCNDRYIMLKQKLEV